MDPLEERVRDFLKSQKMDYEDIDMEVCVTVFREEMEKGLKGVPSSLLMIPTYIDIERDIPLDKPVIVLDAGGTNFRVATVFFNSKRKPVIENFSLHSMPGIKGEVSKKEFFETVTDYMNPVLGASASIGFCFSYPTEILPNRDGRLIRFVKEVKAKEVEGELIGENLRAAIGARGAGKDRRVVILNDTVATLLAGRAAFAGRVFDSYVGFILGTGTNCCYIERNVNIKKKKDLDPSKEQIINVESGGFGRAPRGAVDMEFDRTTVDPGMYTFEKMISGAYFGPLSLRTVKTAAEKGLFSDGFSKALRELDAITTKDLDDVLIAVGTQSRGHRGPGSGTTPLASAASRGTGQDLVTLFQLIDRLVERAAKLTAVNISSVILKSDRGKDPRFPVCVTAEGSTFYGLRGLKQKVEYYLKDHLVDKRERYFEIVSVENATLIGAAIAGLTN